MKPWMAALTLGALVAAGPVLAASKAQVDELDQRERQVTAQLNEQQLDHPGNPAPAAAAPAIPGSAPTVAPDTGRSLNDSPPGDAGN